VAEEVKAPINTAMPRDVILVGKKPIMSYATAALMQLKESNAITIKARGMSISSAVDVAEVLTKKLMRDEAFVESVTIGTVKLGEPERNVSTIEIKVANKAKK